MSITRSLEGFELNFTKGRGVLDPANPGQTIPDPTNPNNIVAHAHLKIKMVDDSDGVEVIKSITKETYDPVKMRRWAKQILGLATGDPDGLPGFEKLDTTA